MAINVLGRIPEYATDILVNGNLQDTFFQEEDSQYDINISTSSGVYWGIHSTEIWRGYTYDGEDPRYGFDSAGDGRNINDYSNWETRATLNCGGIYDNTAVKFYINGQTQTLTESTDNAIISTNWFNGPPTECTLNVTDGSIGSGSNDAILYLEQRSKGDGSYDSYSVNGVTKS